MEKRLLQKQKKTIRQPKKAPKSPEFSDREQKPIKGSSGEKKTATKAGKKKQLESLKKSPEFIDSRKEEEEELPKDNKGEKNTSFNGDERSSPKFFWSSEG